MLELVRICRPAWFRGRHDGRKAKIRTILAWPKNGGKACDTKTLTVTEDCNQFGCDLCGTFSASDLGDILGVPEFADVSTCGLTQEATACLIQACEYGYASNTGTGTITCDIAKATVDAPTNALAYAGNSVNALFCSPAKCTAGAIADVITIPCDAVGGVVSGTMDECLCTCKAGYRGAKCNTVIRCDADQYVSSNACVGCPAGTTNAKDDDASLTDTACVATLCDVDQYVSSNACVVCPAGTTNAKDDDASLTDTACDGTFCDADQYVSSNVCVGCPAGTTNAKDDDASLADTACDDPQCAATDCYCVSQGGNNCGAQLDKECLPDDCWNRQGCPGRGYYCKSDIANCTGGECSNTPSAHMNSKGKTCDQYTWGMKNRCIKSPFWVRAKTCRKSCFDAGFGYNGDF